MRTLKIILLLTYLIFFSQSISYTNENSILLNKISKNLRCLICQGQSVYDSQSDFALSMKLVIKRKLSENLSEDEIYEYLKKQYGEWIVYEPELDKKNILLWAFPLILFIIGGIIIFTKTLKIIKK
tara:strand:- start:1275 stop:1652 length:378 start_codon:yes stop_codon:yes gene_type:complete